MSAAPFARFGALTFVRARLGEAGVDKRGLWIDDAFTGTRLRVGEVSLNMAAALSEQGNRRAVEQALSRPHFGVWIGKTF